MAEATKDQSTEPKQRARKKPLEVRIVLDTNLLCTGSASDLLRQEAASLIEDSRRHSDLQFAWYIPEIVKLERVYQMREAARELLPPLAKLEKLLGHNLGIGEAVLDDRVNSAIDKQVTGPLWNWRNCPPALKSEEMKPGTSVRRALAKKNCKGCTGSRRYAWQPKHLNARPTKVALSALADGALNHSSPPGNLSPPASAPSFP